MNPFPAFLIMEGEIVHKINPLTESALMATLTVVISVAVIYIPFIGTLCVLLWAVPTAILTSRHGPRYGLMSVITAFAVMALIIGPVRSFGLCVAFAPGGLTLGYCLHKNYGIMKIFLCALTASTIAKFLGLLLAFALTSVNPMDMQLDVMKEYFGAMVDIYREAGVDATVIAEMEERMRLSLELVMLIMPLMVLIMGLVETCVAYWLMGIVMSRLHADMPKLPPFSQWRFSVAFLYLMGFALVGIYWGESRQIDLLYRLSVNASVLSLMLGLVEGLSLIRFATLRFNISRLVFVLIAVIVLSGGILTQIVAMIGLVDMLFDYRRHFEQ